MPKPRKPKGLSQLTKHAQQSHERCVRQGEALAAHWEKQGFAVRVSVDPLFQYVDGKQTAAVVGFTVTSDMVNGLPRDYGVVVLPKVRRRRAEDAGGLFHY